MNTDVIRKIAKYLNTQINNIVIDDDQTLKLSINGREYSGLATIILKLAEISKQPFFKDSEQLYQIYQWLEFASYYETQAVNNSSQRKSVLKELNIYLEDYSYLVGYCKTIADVVVYHVLYEIIATMSPSERESHLNLCRWFDHIQYDELVRQDNKFVNFSANYANSKVSVLN